MKCIAFTLILMVNSLSIQQTSPSEAGQPPRCGLKDIPIQAKLLSPLGTMTASPGDAFTMSIESPESYRNGAIEGTVKTLVKAERGFGKGKPKIELEFDRLTYGNRTCRITGELAEVTNSKGVAKVDDEGRVIGHTSNKKRIGGVLGGMLVGALAGAAAGGGTGAAVGAVAGGVAGFALVSTMTTTGTDIQFQPGAIFTLHISDSRKNATVNK